MALSNSQYDHLMRTYEQKQLDNEFQLRKRYEKAYALIPELEEVDHSISSLSVKKARLLLSLTKRTFQPVLCPIIPGIISIRLPDVLLWNQWKLH